MELEYVLKAVRRFWPVVVAFVLLGIVGSYVVKPNSATRYESAALVLVVPPADSSQAATQGDRYVASQLVIMRSPPIAERATELANEGTLRSDAVTFEQIAGTDVVRVIASAPTPTSAQAIANAYVAAYLERSAGDSGTGSADEPTKLETSLEEVETQLSAVDQQIEQAMQPYTNASADDPQVSLPDIVQVAPALATQREVLLDTYRSLLQQRNALEFDPADQTGSQIVQSATLPLAPTTQSRRIWTVALPLLGLLSGIAAATFLARLSRHVLDDVEVSEELGLSFAGQVPYKPVLAHEGLLQVGSLPPDYDEHVSALCVQVEARAQLDRALTIAVSGAQRLSGATTLAAAMAARFGQLGLTVLLVDLDLEQPTLSRHFGIRNDGISALLQLDPDATTSSTRRSRAFASTPWTNVRVIGRSPGLANGRPQRADVLNVMRTASQFADVVIVDTGPMLVAPAAAVLAHHAQVVVVTIPVPRQERVALERIAQQLAPVQANVLPVETPALRHSVVRRLLHRARPPKASTPEQTETEPDPSASAPRRRRTDAKAAADDDGARDRPAAG